MPMTDNRKIERVVFTQTGADNRRANHSDEWFMNLDGQMIQGPSADRHVTIYTREVFHAPQESAGQAEPEPEPVDLRKLAADFMGEAAPALPGVAEIVAIHTVLIDRIEAQEKEIAVVAKDSQSRDLIMLRRLDTLEGKP